MMIDQYLEDRKRAGEDLNPESPLIREQYDSRDKKQVANPRLLLGRNAIVQLMHEMLIASGLRIPVKGANGEGRRARCSKRIYCMHG
jgi:hypothetical protein